MKYTSVIILLFLPIAAHSMDAQIATAEKLYRSGKVEDAKKIITTYISNHESASGYISVGNLYARMRMWPDSVHYIEIATKREPHNALAWYELGLAQHQNKQVNDSIDSLRHSLTISSTTAKTYIALGQILELAGDRYDARANYMAAQAKVGENAQIRARLCWLFFRDNFFVEAIKQCQASVKLEPANEASWAILGRAYYQNQQKKEAFGVFQKIIQARPHSAIAYKARGLIYLEEKTYEQATADLGKAFGLNADDDEAAIGLARSLFETSHYAEALPVYIEACKLERNYRYELLSKQRDLSRKNKTELSSQYQEAVDRF